MLTERRMYQDTDKIRSRDTRISSTRLLSTRGYRFDFEDELETSRVYLRTAKHIDTLSTVSSVIHTASWSFFSAMSVSGVSNISAFKIPVASYEIYNIKEYEEPNMLPDVQVLSSAKPSDFDLQGEENLPCDPPGEAYITILSKYNRMSEDNAPRL